MSPTEHSDHRIAFVYANPRRDLAAAVAARSAPDSTLLGQNHLAELGLLARIHDPVLRPFGGPLMRRVLWGLREVLLPLELPSPAQGNGRCSRRFQSP